MKNKGIIKRVALLLSISGMAAFNAIAADYYWGVNGNGTWDATSKIWSTTPTVGTLTGTTTTNADSIYFSADNITAGTITLAGTQLANQVWLKQAFNISGGQINLSGGAQGYLNINASGTISSQLNIKQVYFQSTGNTLTLSGNTTYNLSKIEGLTEAVAKASEIIVTSGTITGLGHLNIGNLENGTGGLVIKQGAKLDLASGVHLSRDTSNKGLLRVEGGLVAGSQYFIIGRGSGREGKVIMTSGTIDDTSSTYGIELGFENGKGTLDIQGGLLKVAKDVALGVVRDLGAVQSGTGIFKISGSAVAIVDRINFGGGGSYVANGVASGTGILEMSGGALYTDKGLVNTGSGTYGYGIVLSGGTLGAGTTSLSWSSTLNMKLNDTNGGVTFAAADVNGATRNIELSGTLSGSGKFFKDGAGTLLLSGVNTYNGDAIISAGTLEVASALTLNTLTFALDGENVGSVTGAGALTLNDIAFDMTNAGDSGRWDVSSILSVTTINWSSGDFNINGWTEKDGGWENSLYRYEAGIITTIPEPSTLTLIGVGVALLTLSGLRRRK